MWFAHLLGNPFVLRITHFHTLFTTADVPRLAPLYVHTRQRAPRPARSWRNQSHSHPSWTIVQWSQWMTNRNCLSVWTVSIDISTYDLVYILTVYILVNFTELIPRPARACSDPPLYFRLRMGKPIGKAIPQGTTVMSYGKNKLRAEYWFSVPKNR